MLLQLLFVLLLTLMTMSRFPWAAAAAEGKPSDTDALTVFRNGADAHGILAANWSSSDACSGQWVGVGCSTDGRWVTSLSLPSLDLRGPLDPLARLRQLRVLDLHANRLNGTLLPLLAAGNLPNLKLLYLSHNDITGTIPDSIGLLPRLLRIDLSDNSLRGPIPGASFANLTRLLTLRLQDNLLAGLLPDLSSALPRLADFNASNNQLSGRLPDAMRARFGVASFAGNAGLCGPLPPLPPCSFLPHLPSPSSSSSSQSVVPSNPASSSSSPAGSSSRGAAAAAAGKGGLSTGAIVGIAVGNAVFLLLLMSLLIAYCCCSSSVNAESLGTKYAKNKEEQKKKNRRRGGRIGLEEGEDEDEMQNGGKGVRNPSGPGRCSDGGDSDGARSKLVFFGVDGDEEEDGRSDSSGGVCGGRRGSSSSSSRFELEELLRASAEMVGKGSLGTVYRAVLEDGRMVAVKRLRDTNPCGREEFHRYMDLIGRLRHPNLVPLRAFYYAKQEKLLIYDYLPNGPLHSRLHGNRVPGQMPLDWTTRVRLLLGAARGLACIHQEYGMSRIPHGNIKSSNVLLDKNGVARVADFGLALLLSPAHAIARLGGYMAPEQAGAKRRLSQEADVYSFGVLILEVLTGRVPAQYMPVPLADPNSQNKDKKAGLSLPEWVRSVVREEWTAEVFDVELLRYNNIQEEMVAMLHAGLACVAQQPEHRPLMTDVVKMIENIPPFDQSPRRGEDMVVSASPSIGITTDDGDGRLSC